MRMNWVKVIALATSLVTLASLAGGALAADLPVVNVAYMADIHGAAPLAIGFNQKFFEEVGIKVNAVKFLSGPPEIDAMAAGQIDIAYIGPGAMWLCAQGRAIILTVDSLNTGDVLLAAPQSGIKTLSDLKGKTVIVPKGTSGEMILNLALDKAGLTQKDLNVVGMDVAQGVAAFIAGKADAIATWNPYTQEILKRVEGVKQLVDNTAFFPEFVFPQMWVVSPKFLKEHPDLVEKFMKAWIKANDFRAANQEKTILLTAGYTGFPVDSLKAQNDTTKWLTSAELARAYKDGSAAKWFENLERMFVEFGRIPAVVKADKFFDPGPFLNALK